MVKKFSRDLNSNDLTDFSGKMTEIQTTWNFSQYQIGQIWSHVKHVSCESFLSHLKIRPVAIPILMKDLFLNLFEP